MPFTEVQDLSEAWAYFNKRIQEMGFPLASAELELNGIRFLKSAQLWERGIRSKRIHDRPAIVFQYLNEFGQLIDMYQARMIGDPPPFDAPPVAMSREEYSKKLKDEYPKYIAGRGQYDLYFPLLTGLSWMELPTVFITEGIPKAIKACRSGIPCVSIQGKDMFRAHKSDLLVPGLERLLQSKALKKIIYICDSDGKKQEILDSASILTNLLNHRRPGIDKFAEFAVLPDTPNFEKTGLDDYLLYHPVNEFFDKLPTWILPEEGSRYSSLMEKLNQLLCLVGDTTTYVNRITRNLMKHDAATITAGHILSAAGTIVTPTGATIRNGAATLTNTFDRDPNKTTANSLDFWPGKPEFITQGNRRIYNLWQNAAVLPVKGDVSPFLDLLNFTIPDPVQQDLLLQLVTHRIYHPDLKSPLMIFLYGGEGTGKSCLATALFAAITDDPEYRYIGYLNLSYSHEDNHIHKQCVCMEEPSKSGMTNKDLENILKLVGDAEQLTVNPKGLPQYRARNRTLFWINTNDHYAPVSGEARRWLFLEAPRLSNKIVTRACWDWMRDNEGFAEHLNFYLRERYPVVDEAQIRELASNLVSKTTILAENKNPAVLEYEDTLEKIPDELLDIGVVPTKLLNQYHPYATKNFYEMQSITRVLGVVYPLYKQGINAEGKVKVVDGVTTTFRLTRADFQGTYTTLELKDIYKKWEDYFTKRKF